MSLQWTLVAGFLYLEILLTLLLVFPVLSPQRWSRILRSNFMKTLNAQASWYFYIIIVILILFLLDAVREMRKYASDEALEHAHAHLDAEMQTSMRLFRAQRNFYISGFALFLSVVIRRVIHLLSSQAGLIAQSEAALKQAQSASAVAKSMLKKSGGKSSSEGEQNAANEAHDKEMSELKEKITELKEELEKQKKDKEAVKSQAESVTKEYDRLLKEHAKLQEGVSASGDKKRE